MSIVYLNGDFVAKEEAKISANDRGFLFGDGIYEATPFYRGQPFTMDQHWARLENGLSFLRIKFPETQESLLQIFQTLLQKNQLDKAKRSMVYLQVTRGATPTRFHGFPTDPVPPTVYAFCKELAYPSPERWTKGFSAALAPDQRWGRVDIKTVNLLPNVLAFQDAKEQGADEAILHKDGVAMEGSHTNLFAILEIDNVITLVTHPTTNHILPGITRAVVLEEARGALDIVVEERPIKLEELRQAKEVFLTSTTSEVKPVVMIDKEPIGDGKAGATTRRLWDLFAARIERDTGVSVVE